MRLAALLFAPIIIVGCAQADSSEVEQTNSAEVESARVELTLTLTSLSERTGSAASVTFRQLTIVGREGKHQETVSIMVGEAPACDEGSVADWAPAQDNAYGVLVKLLKCSDGDRADYVGLFAKNTTLTVVSQSTWTRSRVGNSELSKQALAFSTPVEANGKPTVKVPSVAWQ